MKRLLSAFAVMLLFCISAYAETGMPAKQQGQMGQGMMMGQGQQMHSMCPKMQQMHGQGMGGGPQMMGGMRGERMGRYHPWFRHGVSLILQNSEKLGLTDQQKAKLNDIRRKYTKEIIRQDADAKIAEIDLEPLLKESEINLPKVKEALKKIEGIETQIKYLKIEAFTEARKVLTDEQKATLRKMMEEHAPMMMRGMMGTHGAMEQEEETEMGTTPKSDPHAH
jgi:Spy/CpxP family protein refolding chaperone